MPVPNVGGSRKLVCCCGISGNGGGELDSPDRSSSEYREYALMDETVLFTDSPLASGGAAAVVGGAALVGADLWAPRPAIIAAPARAAGPVFIRLSGPPTMDICGVRRAGRVGLLIGSFSGFSLSITGMFEKRLRGSFTPSTGIGPLMFRLASKSSSSPSFLCLIRNHAIPAAPAMATSGTRTPTAALPPVDKPAEELFLSPCALDVLAGPELVGVITVDGVTTGAVTMVVLKCFVTGVVLPSLPVVVKTVSSLVTLFWVGRVVGLPMDVIGASVCAGAFEKECVLGPTTTPPEARLTSWSPIFVAEPPTERVADPIFAVGPGATTSVLPPTATAAWDCAPWSELPPSLEFPLLELSPFPLEAGWLEPEFPEELPGLEPDPFELESEELLVVAAGAAAATVVVPCELVLSPPLLPAAVEAGVLELSPPPLLLELLLGSLLGVVPLSVDAGVLLAWVVDTTTEVVLAA